MMFNVSYQKSNTMWNRKYLKALTIISKCEGKGYEYVTIFSNDFLFPLLNESNLHHDSVCWDRLKFSQSDGKCWSENSWDFILAELDFNRIMKKHRNFDIFQFLTSFSPSTFLLLKIQIFIYLSTSNVNYLRHQTLWHESKLNEKENDNIYATRYWLGRVEKFSIRFLIAYGKNLNLMLYDYDYYTI